MPVLIPFISPAHALQDSKSTSGLYFKQLEESALRADELAEELESAHSEIQVSEVFLTF
jgi:hypothetical protein